MKKIVYLSYSGRRRHRGIASYELTLRVENDNAIILVDLRLSLNDDLEEMTLIEVTRGRVEVTFVAHTTAFWDTAADNGEKVVLLSRNVNIADGRWHRIEIRRYIYIFPSAWRYYSDNVHF